MAPKLGGLDALLESLTCWIRRWRNQLETWHAWQPGSLGTCLGKGSVKKLKSSVS